MSGTLLAEEVVFTTLAVKYSPSRRGGYQFVYIAPGLSEADRETILEKVASYSSAMDGSIRWQFFSLAGGRSVATRTQAIPPDAEISDQRGSFLVYGVVVSAAEFAHASFDPFQVLDALDFPQTAQEVVNRYGSGSQPAAKIELSPVATAFPEESWPLPALRELLALTLAAEELVTARRTVLIHGSADARLQALRLALKITPQGSRSACTFDTEGNVHLARTGRLWAAGMATLPRETDDHPHIDASLHEVQGRIPPPPSNMGASLYGRWFNWITSLEGENGRFSATLAANVETLAGCLDGGGSSSESLELDETACQDLEQLWAEEMRSTLRSRIVGHTTESVATGLVPWLKETLTAQERLTLALHGTSADLSPHLVSWIFAGKPKLGARDWMALASLGRQHSSPLLVLLATVLGKGEKGDRLQALEALGREQFSQLLTLCPERIAPHLLVSHQYLDALVDWVLANPLKDEVLRDFVEEALLSDCGAGLDRLAGSIFKMSDRSQHKLVRWLSKHPEVFCSWRPQLEKHVGLATMQTPWWRRILPGKRPSSSSSE